MKDKEVLQKAIEKVTTGEGFSFYIGSMEEGYATHGIKKEDIVEELFCLDFPFANELDVNKYYPFIFSHDFAKAFWKSISCHHDGEAYRHTPPCKTWQYQLQQIVLEENPIDYLRQFIK